jgi:hypothetical protein
MAHEPTFREIDDIDEINSQTGTIHDPSNPQERQEEINSPIVDISFNDGILE